MANLLFSVGFQSALLSVEQEYSSGWVFQLKKIQTRIISVTKLGSQMKQTLLAAHRDPIPGISEQSHFPGLKYEGIQISCCCRRNSNS